MASRDVREHPTPGALRRPDTENGLLGTAATRLSWSLGDQLLARDNPDRAFDCEHARTAARITAFDATDTTFLIRIRTPVGRERYYELPADAFEECVRALTEDSAWRTTADARGRNA